MTDSPTPEELARAELQRDVARHELGLARSDLAVLRAERDEAVRLLREGLALHNETTAVLDEAKQLLGRARTRLDLKAAGASALAYDLRAFLASLDPKEPS